MLGALGDEVELVTVAELLAGHVDDFLDMAAKVGDGTEQGSRDVGVEALDAAAFDKLFGGKAGEDSFGFGHSFLELGKNFGFGAAAVVGEFQRAVTDVFSAADAGDDPLADVAGEMEHQVGDAVHFRSGDVGRGWRLNGWPPPDLVVGELVNTVLDFVAPFGERVTGGGEKESGQGHFCQ